MTPWFLVAAAMAAGGQSYSDPRGDAPGPQNPDLVRATHQRIAGREVITFRTAHAFRTFEAPALYIVHRPHEYFVNGQGSEFGGFGPGQSGPRARVTRPSSTSVRYSFKAGDLGLKDSYRWYGRSGVLGSFDKLPNKGNISSTLPG
jgi:hypothetical protein